MAIRVLPVIVGIKGTVLAIDRATGNTLWQADLKGSDFVSVSLEGNELFAASRGQVYRLDPATGNILWTNSLPGLGWGIVAIAADSSGAAAAAEKRRADAAAAAGAAAAGA